VVRAGYVPDRGDVVWLDFDPQAGREQAGRRPAVVLSPSGYNSRSGLALLCPVTSHAKGYPFECSLPKNFPIQGVVLSDHVRSLDWKSRQAGFICHLPVEVIEDITAKIVALVSDE
jgi:mRNA interferase MazF